MARILYTPSTTPVSPPPSALLLFIQQAQMALCTRATDDRLKASEQPPAAAA